MRVRTGRPFADGDGLVLMNARDGTFEVVERNLEARFGGDPEFLPLPPPAG
ncbi:MAG TPA: hypothetical protein VFI28_02460 [Candidatus Limnocylindrales bacterium]|nr:hypothetical protein [Candidatus Limnocylindrales bacterium]